MTPLEAYTALADYYDSALDVYEAAGTSGIGMQIDELMLQVLDALDERIRAEAQTLMEGVTQG